MLARRHRASQLPSPQLGHLVLYRLLSASLPKLMPLPSSRHSSSNSLSDLLSRNRAWADRTAASDPNLFARLAKGQSPHTLWIGCADSRVPETTLLGAEPGEVFVHRNIANIVNSTDLSSVSVIEYAVNHLGVKRIVLCGHTSCGGVGAALGNSKVGKIDTWLMPLRALRVKYADELEKLSEEERKARVVELNVLQGVDELNSNPDVISASKERGLEVHGVIYDLATGQLREVNTSDNKQTLATRIAAFKTA